MELYIQETETKGRGVFCDETILEGQVIEICPVLVLPPKDRTLIDKSALEGQVIEICPVLVCHQKTGH